MKNGLQETHNKNQDLLKLNKKYEIFVKRYSDGEEVVEAKIECEYGQFRAAFISDSFYQENKSKQGSKIIPYYQRAYVVAFGNDKCVYIY